MLCMRPFPGTTESSENDVRTVSVQDVGEGTDAATPQAARGRHRLGWWVRHRGWAVPLLVALAFGLLQVATEQPGRRAPDSTMYARQVLEMTGTDWSETIHDAALEKCRTEAADGRRTQLLNPMRMGVALPAHPVRSCVEQTTASVEQAARSTPQAVDRYSSIFRARPGYPLLAVPFVTVLGLSWGLWVPALCCGLLAGALVGTVLRVLGAGLAPALLGQTLFYVLPTGYWSTLPLTEGPMLASTMAALLGVVLLVRQRGSFWWNVALLQLGLGAGFVLRYSSAELVAGALTLASLVVVMAWRADRARWMVATVAAVNTTGQLLLARALGWPGAAVTLQDTFTRHFQTPDVSDPWARLVTLNGHFWRAWLGDHAARPLLLLALVAAVWALWRWSRPVTVLLVAVSATSVATLAAHPLLSEASRLGVLLWLPVAWGLPLWLTRTHCFEAPEGDDLRRAKRDRFRGFRQVAALSRPVRGAAARRPVGSPLSR